MLDASDPLIGRLVGGDFEIVRAIASGGMGAVYEASQRSTGKARALKVMHGFLLRDAKMRARFIDEARTAGSIDSDYVVEVVSAGIDEELGVPWIAMELLRGQTLAQHVEKAGALGPEVCLEALRQACEALALAHERGLVHRDLKPDNLFVAAPRRRGVPFTMKVLDFGIAKWVHDARGDVKNSQAMGTPSWMAPEQLSLGDAITPATDVWAIGLIAFWMMTGKEYWVAANDATGSISSLLLELVTSAHVPASTRAARLGALRALPHGFDAWFERCVQRDPTQRFRNAASCIDALTPILDGVAAVPSTPELDLTSLLLDLPSASAELLAVAASSNASGADDDAAWWIAQAAALDSDGDHAGLERWLGRRSQPRPTALPLGPDGLRDLVFAGPPSLAALTSVCELVATRLVPSPLPSGRSPNARHLPDQVRDAVQHAALILGAADPAIMPIGGEEPAFRLCSLEPLVLGASSVLRAESSPLVLRAKAGVALARARMGLGLVGALASEEELDDVIKAATALARGTISPSRHFRSLVSGLGARRKELARAIDAARSIPPGAWWSAAKITLARAALLTSADPPSALAALHDLVPPSDDVREALSKFVLAPSFADFWHRPSGSRAF